MQSSVPQMTTGQRASVRVLALLGLLLFSLLFLVVAADALGLIASHPTGSPDDPPPSAEALAGAASPGEAVHVAASLAVLATGASGLVALLLRPQRSGSAYHVIASATAIGARGWRLAATAGGLGAVAVGAASVVDPSAASAVGRVGGAAVLAWGLAAVLSAARGAGRVRETATA